jgi:DtxR family transcriptional regulator, Mn-dependent transcriptional regulator
VNLIFVMIICFVIVLVILILIKKDFGFLTNLKKSNQDRFRILIEDSLKHLYDCEEKSIDCSLNSLSGNLAIKGGESTKVVSKLEAMGFISSSGNKFLLTVEGRSYALRIIRIHRLWERYLADYTSVEEKDWHRIAEEREHLTTEEDANYLAARLGNPLIDPHGDPIPNERLEILTTGGITLNTLEVGKYAKIVHLEDEPKETYAQLAAIGLYPGTQIYLLESSISKIRFEADGNECVLAPVLASNVTVIPIEEKEKVQELFETLSSLKLNEEARVIGISNAMRGQQRRRMLDFGIVPGTKIQTRLRSLKGDPSAYEIRGTLIAIRKNQSDLIFVKRIEKE